MTPNWIRRWYFRSNYSKIISAKTTSLKKSNRTNENTYVCVSGWEMLVFPKNLRTYLINDPSGKQTWNYVLIDTLALPKPYWQNKWFSRINVSQGLTSTRWKFYFARKRSILVANFVYNLKGPYSAFLSFGR